MYHAEFHRNQRKMPKNHDFDQILYFWSSYTQPLIDHGQTWRARVDTESTITIIIKNWLQFLFIVKAAVRKQQISKFYPQILSTEASDHIYFSQQPFINVKAIFCA